MIRTHGDPMSLINACARKFNRSTEPFRLRPCVRWKMCFAIVHARAS